MQSKRGSIRRADQGGQVPFPLLAESADPISLGGHDPTFDGPGIDPSVGPVLNALRTPIGAKVGGNSGPPRDSVAELLEARMTSHRFRKNHTRTVKKGQGDEIDECETRSHPERRWCINRETVTSSADPMIFVTPPSRKIRASRERSSG